LSGWEVSGITRFQSGPYLTVVQSFAGLPGIGNRRADYLGVAIPVDNKTPQRWFNTDAFACAPDTTGAPSSTACSATGTGGFRRGNTGVGAVSGPGIQNWDFTLRKQQALTEKIRLRFTADFFNLFNHTNFRGLNVNRSNADFGSVTQAAPARSLQLGLKLEF